MGATGFGYDLAETFGLKVTPPRPALAPLTFAGATRARRRPLAGIALDARVSTVAPGKTAGKPSFAAPILFTHRGLSGPAILQISSFWRGGEEIAIALAPGTNVYETLRALRTSHPRQSPHTALARWLPKRLAEAITEREGVAGNLADLPDRTLRALDAPVNPWHILPAGTEDRKSTRLNSSH